MTFIAALPTSATVEAVYTAYAEVTITFVTELSAT